MASSSTQPNSTLYINNLNDKVNKDELKVQLYALFTTYGKIIDIIASKSEKLRGQAWLIFADLAGATSAMRACEGMIFYDKPLHIHYARSKSYATLRKEDPNFIPPTAANASDIALAHSAKRLREDETADNERQAKREKSDEDEEEMEIDDDDEPSAKNLSVATSATIPQQLQYPSARLLCTNLPQEVTDSVLSVLFQQYRGFQTAQVTWSPTPNTAGARVKMAQVFFESPELASTAKEALDGFTLKKGWQMSVVYI
ncbi:hypothetical protein BDQ17DRAFT_1351723 [Cyathus striatus]|nr:hypothetical protein BDQ17DRAFT_1351723 [Cyathus striatus]